MFEKAEEFGRKYVPSFLKSFGKSLVVGPRFQAQLSEAKKGYNEFGKKYPQSTLFVAGLPKSGTTWLEKMLGTLNGFQEVMIPEAVMYGEKHGESHTFDFPEDTFSRLDNALTILKLHVHGSKSNYDIITKNNLNFVAIYRDLRDVAVSYLFYIKRTTHHPEHQKYRDLSNKDGLLTFSKEILPGYVKWVNSWHQYETAGNLYIVRYEDLKTDTFNQMKNIFKHYKITLSDEEINDIIEANSFKKLSGRKSGEQSTKSFFRKGISGDWKNHFDEEVIASFKENLGDFLDRYGYEPF